MSWLRTINSINWSPPPMANQTVAISYREGEATGAFVSAGTVVFKPDGQINGTPNPFVIPAIDDAWLSIEVKYVNSCNEEEVFQTFSKPV